MNRQLRRSLLTGITTLALVVSAACSSAGSSDTPSDSQSGTNNGSNTSESSSSNSAASGGDITIGATQAWSGFNPYQPDQGKSITLAIDRALFPSAFEIQSDQSAKLNDDLLADAEIVSSDPQTIKYTINPDAVWSDGEPITADDFIYLWEHMRGTDDKLQITSSSGYSQIESVTGSDEGKTVTVVFSAPYGDWRSLFAMLLPAHYMKSLGDDPDAWNTGLMKPSAPSGGPFVVSDFSDGSYLVLKRNPEWYGTPAKPDSLTIRLFGDDQALIQGLASGEVDYAQDIRATRGTIAQAKALSGVTTSVTPTTNQQFLMVQMERPIMGQLAVRQAIATVVDPEAIASTVFGADAAGVLTTNHILAPSSANYQDNRPEQYGHGDVDAAGAILEDAGWTLGDDGIRVKDGTKLELTYAVQADQQLASQVGVILQDDLKKAGIQLNIKTVASADWFAMLRNGDLDLGLGNMPASAFPASWYSALYQCDAGYNFARICDDDVDALFKQANIELDPQEQGSLLNQIDARLWELVGNIPVWEVPQLQAHNSELTGVDPALEKEYQILSAAGWSLNG